MTNTGDLLNSCLSLLTPRGLGFVSYLQADVYGICCAKSNYPDAWQTYYLERKLIQSDPVITTAVHDSILREWPGIDRDNTTSSFFETARAFGVPDRGAAVGFQTGAGLSIFSVAFEGSVQEWCETFAAHETELNLIAMTFCFNASRMRKTVHLTSRECDVMRWLIRGKTSWEIGQILNLTEGTINQYLRVIMKKLDAANRVECAVKALEQDVLVPGLISELTT
ncbi:MAG: LuxR C-terminal-related transcriptional regulator [Pseudomonadota bacterium]